MPSGGCPRSAGEPEDAHPYGQAVGDLVEDQRLRAVGNLSCHLDATVDRAGRENEQIFLGTLESLAGHGVEMGVFADRRKGPRVLPFELDAKKIEDVATGHDRIEIV